MKKFMSWSLTITLFVTGNAFAGFPAINIQNLKGNFQNEQGTATAQVFRVPEVNFGNGKVNFEVFKQAGNYVLKANDQEFTWINPPMELDQVHTLNWSEVNVLSTAKAFEVTVGSLDGDGEKDSVILEGLKASCIFQPSDAIDEADDFLHSCLNNEGSLAVRKVIQNKTKSMTSITNINFRNKKNRFTFNITSGVRMHGYGKVWYHADQGVVKIRIDSAKWKFVSVKARLFKELAALESDTVKVNNPWIEIQVEK